MENQALTVEEIRERAQEVFRNHLKHLTDGDINAWINLWAEDGVLEFPYAPKGYPDIMEGKADIYDYMKSFPKNFEIEFTDLIFHITEDPELVIAELNSVGKQRETGNPYNQTYISVVETKDGFITRYKDYWNPLVFIDSFGS
ncbi:MAG: nuclear transport factor 2 family protein [Heyndrickxia sp.]